jgi:hypothetical protein
MKTSFWTYFTSAYGMIWMILLGTAFLVQEHLDAGLLGLFGFPLIAAIYALIRRAKDNAIELKQQQHAHSPAMTDFLAAHPEFGSAPTRLRNTAFHKWLNDPEVQ